MQWNLKRAGFFTIGLRARSFGYRFRGQRRLFEPGPFGPSEAFMPRRTSECMRAGTSGLYSIRKRNTRVSLQR
eukprot:9256491-Lingulodinium_polyedra.AAC.1